MITRLQKFSSNFPAFLSRNQNISSSRGNRTPGALWVGLLLMFILAGYLRVAHLGKYDLQFDELLHVMAAKALLTSGHPTLPSGLAYTRGAAFTRLMAETFRFLPQNEASARIPSVVFNLLLMVSVVYLSRRWYGPNVALVAAFLFAVSPLDVLTSRFARMYAPLGVTYFLSAILAYAALNQDRKVAERVLYVLVAGSALAVSINLHIAAVTFFPAFAAYCLIMSPREKQHRVLVGIGVFILGLLIIEWNFVAGILTRARTALPWMSVRDSLYFVRFLWEHYTWLCFIYPLGIAVALWNDGKKCAYVACHFLVPLFLLTALAETQAPRYISHLMPFFFIPVAVGLAFLIENGFAWLKRWCGGGSASLARKAGLVCGALGCVVMVLSTSNWLQESVEISQKRTYLANGPVPVAFLSDLSRRVWNGKDKDTVFRTAEIYETMGLQFPAWRQAAQYISKQQKNADIIISESPVASYYYLGRADYTINPGLKNAVFEVRAGNGNQIAQERYIGSRYIRHVDDMKRLTRHFRRGWVILTDHYFLDWNNKRPKNAMGRFFFDHLTMHPFPSETRVMIFSWGVDRGITADPASNGDHDR